ncbi:tripartite tricarboxylate transporter substrate-binding protein [Belnapia rosea]|uniref:Tripartite-type tricarboxylate transporter, receptor component TctC n=1 Tax=Belnapia rosea TaxID=938405 RepID=A0A1G6KIE3_9PROT|nr:tripartite tricarboxylate transporter substrate-binding protein [Belnapia rosea]SDB18898.1 Tripartite-type tricarboxylate transporter, receptor component TctC [Belnapia rosea]SDC30734.1 Tripartite-type tricarboxylate transporter, receptor component TctC [Belnapia rosea]
MRRRSLLAGLALPALAPALARAQAWPHGPIRIIAPFPPGGSVDTIARLLVPSLQSALGVPVVVENRSGAAGALGTGIAARAAPDGQSWVLVFDSHVTVNALNPSAGFDARRDFAPVMLIASAPMLLTTPANRPWRTVAEVVAAAKMRPEATTYGTVGAGSLAHLSMEVLQQRGGFRLTHVPYRGGGPLATAAVGGEIDLAIASRVGLGGQVGTRLRALAQTGAKRSPSLPDLPTIAESGFPGFDAEAFWGMLGPAGVPAPILARFHAALAAALAEPATRERLVEGQGVDIVASSPEGFGAFLDRQITTWSRVVSERDIRAD